MSDTTEHVDIGSLAATLSRLADTLASATSPTEIYDAALEGIRSAVGVERASVQVYDDDGVIRFKASRGLSEEYRRSIEGASPWRMGQHAPAPVIVADVTTDPSYATFLPAFAREKIRALTFVPLLSKQKAIGKFVLYWADPHKPGQGAIDAAIAIGAFLGLAVDRARQNAEHQSARQHEAEARERLTRLAEESQRLQQHALKSAERAEFLADISARLTSLDYEQNLDAIATLIVPRFADWCVVDVLEGGELHRLAMAHTDPSRIEYAQNILRRYPPRRDRPGGPWEVVRTGEPILYERIDDDFLARAARNDEHLEMLHKAGPRSLMFVPLKRGNDVFGVLWFVLADSERHYDRDDLAFAEELARRAAYAIENARLYRQAQDANRAKDEFLAALSHELRTPLNAILGWASILRARPDGEIERGLDVIYRNAVVQTHLVEDLLDASRIVSGRMSIDLKDTPLRPILHAAIETILPQATEKAIEVISVLPQLDVQIRGDSARLQQVFWNVLSNAVKFTPRGGHIKITTEGTPSEIAVLITDTGAGIRPEALPYIFDRFKQADAATTTRRYRGLGLGLTLSRQLTEMHGGRIAAESAGPGLGSTFTVALPLVERSTFSAARTTVAAPGNSLDGIRVLAVDDDPDSLEVLVSILRTQSAMVIGATSAIEALEMLQKERPQIVVSDIAMPDRDGYWLMEQLRRLASEGGPNVPGVALTAFANARARERALATGFVAHLSKPFDPDQLIHTILNAVAAH